MIGGLAMKKVTLTKKLLLPFGIFCLTMLIPLPGTYNTAQAASSVSTDQSTEEKQSEVKLNVKKKSLVEDTSYNLVLYNLQDSYKVSFKSSDNEIASVDKDGVVTAVKVGEATITVTVKDGLKTIQTLTCDIKVGVAAQTIKFNASSITLVVGKSTLLDTIITPNNTVEEPMFSSKETSIATVSSSGRITAKSAGITYIFGTLANGQYARIAVTVVEEDTTPTPTPTPSAASLSK